MSTAPAVDAASIAPHAMIAVLVFVISSLIVV